MTERFPQQRNRSAQRRADADRVRAASENRKSDAPVFDESFVAAAAVREPSAADRARLRHLLPDQRTGEELLLAPPVRWSVRPSRHLAGLRPLPVVAAIVCVLAAATLVAVLLS